MFLKNAGTPAGREGECVRIFFNLKPRTSEVFFLSHEGFSHEGTKTQRFCSAVALLFRYVFRLFLFRGISEYEDFVCPETNGSLGPYDQAQKP